MNLELRTALIFTKIFLMRKMFLLFGSLFLFLFATSQTLKKYEIAKSGCSVYMFCGPGRFEEDYSEDSSKVYTAECSLDDGIHYGIICVKMKESISDLQGAEDMLASYMDYLKVNFGITKAVGYGKGNHLNKREDTRGIVDYWEDDEKNNWKVKGWTDGKFIGVLYAYSKKDLPDKIDVFLNSFRLPGM
jgi:hypothetical protein